MLAPIEHLAGRWAGVAVTLAMASGFALAGGHSPQSPTTET
jgi:hypothetical protein